MRRRDGFTIIELLVAMALIIFIMAILSEAFVIAARTFRTLKATGELAEHLRLAGTLIRNELAADHFNGKKRLSQPDFWVLNPSANSGTLVYGPPDNGFFRIYQGSIPSTTGPSCYLEGKDLDQVSSYRSVDHMLHMTVKLRGNSRSDFFFALDPASAFAGLGNPSSRYQDPTYYSSQWAEVAYFLRPAIDPNTGLQDNANGTPLYSLYRRQKLLVPDTANTKIAVPGGAVGSYPEVSNFPASPGTYFFNGPADVTVPNRRFGMLQSGQGSDAGIFPTPPGTYTTLAEEWNAPPPNKLSTDLSGADVLLTDVISFDIRILLPQNLGTTKDFVDLYSTDVAAYSSGNPAFTAATGPRVFDTWTKFVDNQVDYSTAWQPVGGQAATYKTIPLFQDASGNRISIKAIQIILRVWDEKTALTRQMTIIQDL